MNVYRETIQEFRLLHNSIRVWREAEPNQPIIPQHDDDVSVIIGGVDESQTHFTVEDIADAILELPRVNAVEVKDRAGNGCVLYRAYRVLDPDGFELQVL